MRKSVQFSTKYEVIKPLNEDFTLCKCRIMALGKNRNFSYFSQEAVDDALPTLANIPVIAHVYSDSEGKLRLGGHDCEIVSEDGTYKFKPTTIPWGVVPESHNAHYEEVEESDGTKATYLVANLLLWNRFEDIFKTFYSDDVYANQSMEIEALDSINLSDDSRYEDIKKFTFSALCLLNKGESEDDPDNVTPCFPSSDVQPYKFELDDSFNELTKQLKEDLAKCFGSKKKKGGCGMSEETIKSILEEFSLTIEQLDFEIEENMAEDDFRAKVKDFSEKIKESTEKVKENQNNSFASTYRQKYDALSNMLDTEYEKDDEGNIVKITDYYICDFDNTYVFVNRYIYNYNEDNEETCGRIKYSFDETNLTATKSGDFEKMIVKWLTLEENNEIESKRSEYEELKEFKAGCLKKEHEAKCNSVLAKFSDLDGNEEFEALKTKAFDYDEDALERECFIIRGKNVVIKTTKQKNNFSIKIPIHSSTDNKSEKTEEQEFMERYSD